MDCIGINPSDVDNEFFVVTVNMEMLNVPFKKGACGTMYFPG